ncbi:MAG TPA: Uma2 family endonuclease [Isosphaeraceae bacterium]|nr:Uma2 family endonuclease [Isosphaeraceae bacterium]
MSTVAVPQPRTSPADPGWVPSSLYRVTLEQYEAMVDTGIFTGRDRVHLINGFLAAKMTENDPHATADLLCGDELERVIPPGWHVRPGKPIRIPSPGRDSKPEPDRSVARGHVRDYSRRSPGPADIALVVEVSDTSLSDDRNQAEIYGRAGIPFYWIINLIDGQVEVYSNPGPSGYQSLEVLAPGHVLTVIIDGVAVGEIPVADILP